MPRAYALLIGTALLGGAVPLLHAAEAITLPYQADNKWPDPTQPQPLKNLIQQTSQGTHTYTVTLPTANRPLSAERLHILQTILQKSTSGQGLVIQEAEQGTTPSNTLTLTPTHP